MQKTSGNNTFKSWSSAGVLGGTGVPGGLEVIGVPGGPGTLGVPGMCGVLGGDVSVFTLGDVNVAGKNQSKITTIQCVVNKTKQKTPPPNNCT
jgi:hypothetical protein